MNFKAALQRAGIGIRTDETQRERTLRGVVVIVAVVFLVLNTTALIKDIFDAEWTLVGLDVYFVGLALLPLIMLASSARVQTTVFTSFTAWIPAHMVWQFVSGNDDGVAVFLLIIPISGILVLGATHSIRIMGLFLGATLLIPALDPHLPIVPVHSQEAFFANAAGLFHSTQKHPNSWQAHIFIAVLGSIIYIAMYMVMRERDESRAQVDALLHNAMPHEIVARLQDENNRVSLDNRPTIADEYGSVSILFADIVGFTELSARTPPADLVAILNEIFSEFDTLVERHGVEKIKTIGDAYMVVSGLPTTVPDHAQRLARFSVDMMAAVARYREKSGHALRVRVGLNTGSVVAGVIGQRRFAYDLWGDAVNMASRMESTGTPEAIQVSQDSYAILKEDFDLEYRGEIEVKGKGNHKTWWLKAEKTAGE